MTNIYSDIEYKQLKISERKQVYASIVEIILKYFVYEYVIYFISFGEMKHQLKRGYQRLNAVISVSVDILGIVPTDHNLRDNDSSAVFPSCS